VFYDHLRLMISTKNTEEAGDRQTRLSKRTCTAFSSVGNLDKFWLAGWYFAPWAVTTYLLSAGPYLKDGILRSEDTSVLSYNTPNRRKLTKACQP
jgi:hypothetical protein